MWLSPASLFSPCTMNALFVLPYQVMYYDTDCGGVVHNLAYLRWVEECRTKMSSAIGIDWARLAKEENKHCVLVSHEVHYHSPAFVADEMRVLGGIESVEKSSIYFTFEVRRAEDDKLCVTVRQRLALVQAPQGRPCRIPKEWHDLIANQPE